LGDGISDTGMTLRALLPIVSQETRSMLQSYKGQATVFDSRVTCIRPYLTINSSIVAQISGDGYSLSAIDLSGIVGTTAGTSFKSMQRHYVFLLLRRVEILSPVDEIRPVVSVAHLSGFISMHN
jgi:hypothetical protein